MSESFDTIPAEDRSVIRKHSQSFSLAARMLPRNVRASVERLYAWCRWCDDAVDTAPSMEIANERLQLLRDDVNRIYAGCSPKHSASQWLATLVSEYSIPKQYPLELLDGMEMDLRPDSVKSERDLLLYCHRAAGTVGLMMCCLFQVSDRFALRCADSLGIAMQLTNIARDVKEDWQRKRCYLPRDWFDIEFHTEQQPANDVVREPVRRLLQLADDHYEEGRRGLRYLPPSCERAVRVAAAVYQEIGTVIRQNDFRVMDGRCYVSWPRKLSLAAKQLVAAVADSLSVQGSPIPEQDPSIGFYTFPLEEIMTRDARYIATLGLSLTSILGAALFVLVAFIPKDAETYNQLPWIYAAACIVAACATQWVLHRMESEEQAAAVPIEVRRDDAYRS